MRLPSALGLCLLAASVSAPIAGLACGEAPPAKGLTRAPDDFTAKIYSLRGGEDGKYILGRSGLDGQPKPLFTHQVSAEEGDLDLRALSSDHRHALLDQRTDYRARQQLFLFDAERERELQLLSLPTWNFVSGEFSPDGSQLAIYADFDQREANSDEVGLYLVRTKDGRATFLGRPGEVDRKGHPPYASAHWSRDGSALFLRTNGDAVHYYHVDSATRAFHAVQGRDGRDGPWTKPEFELHGQRLAVQEETPVQSQLLLSSADSPGGWHAHFDEHDVLWLEHGEERRRIIQGPVQPEPQRAEDGSLVVLACGPEFGIQGWIGDRILIYQIESNSYGYDVLHDRSFLFVSDPGADSYWW